MSIGKLILHPGDAELIHTRIEPFIELLIKIELIGDPIDPDQNSFLVGERFLQLISFLGCSTNVCVTPNSDKAGNFCHLRVLGPFDQPKLIWDESSRPPRCTACHRPITNWKDYIDAEKVNCNLCEHKFAPEDISWGRRTGYSRLFIEINNIFPGEAKPVESLLDQLSAFTETKWGYFYTSYSA